MWVYFSYFENQIALLVSPLILGHPEAVWTEIKNALSEICPQLYHSAQNDSAILDEYQLFDRNLHKRRIHRMSTDHAYVQKSEICIQHCLLDHNARDPCDLPRAETIYYHHRTRQIDL